ncbi:hypothetical protein FB384_001211 [Prauserella sediminis]|uniref:DUF5667 domain-containing protein n=1 Tax=Prauserella sediminis TaxID=577680 RepID=A0A839XIH1_9PSEU|nr:DUF5667 domain-containing protein [Prauserella sediminis]MBB3662307.1 hypothetical protein [Prauserella sediminis]
MEPPRILRSFRARRSRASRDEDERFARAVETGEAGRSGEFADELAVIAALRNLGNRTPGGHGTGGQSTGDRSVGDHGTAAGDERDGSLTPAARMRITDRVLAPGPHPTAERHVAGPPPQPQPEPRPESEHPRPGPQPQPARGEHRPDGNSRRRVPAVAAGVAVLLGVGAAALTASGDARPGESFYALKQLREDASLAMTFDDEDRAFRRLDYASDRIAELRSLADDGALDRSALHTGMSDFTEHARSAVAALTSLATTSGGDQLDRLRGWATAETSRLTPLPGTADGTHLLVRIQQRAEALDERMSCLQITSGRADDLGALPTTGDCHPTAPGGGRPGDGDHSAAPDATPGSGDTRPGPTPDDDTATLAGSTTTDPAGTAEPVTAVRATPPWSPPADVPSAHVVRTVPEPPTGPRLPAERPQQPAPVSVTAILSGLTGLDADHD